MQTIVLGSSSITRAELLTRFGVPFIQRDAGFDEESLRINDPAHFVYHATKGKMQSYLETYDLEMPVLCADTVVTANGEILRKAKDKEDARHFKSTKWQHSEYSDVYDLQIENLRVD